MVELAVELVAKLVAELMAELVADQVVPPTNPQAFPLYWKHTVSLPGALSSGENLFCSYTQDRPQVLEK